MNSIWVTKKKVKQKEQLLFSQWKKKNDHFAPEFLGDYRSKGKISPAEKKNLLMILGCNVQKSQRKREDLVYQTVMSMFPIKAQR